jgi:hypothetical protein
LTPDQGKQVATAWLHANLATEVGQERGSLQRIDQAVNLLRTSQPTPDASPHEDTIWLAHQGQYPLTFLCFDKPRLPAQQMQMMSPSMFRFYKADAHAPWTVTHQVTLVSAGSRPAVAVDSAGYAQAVPADQYDKFIASPGRVASDFATYLSRGNSTDTHEFAAGPLTSAVIENTKKRVADTAAQHNTLSATYTSTDDPVDVYLLRDGGALVLFGIKATDHLVAAAGGSISVTEDGKGVTAPAPGKYRELTTVELVLAAFSVPPKGSSAKVAPLGIYTAPVSTVGTPA